MEQNKKVTAEVKHMLKAVKRANTEIERINKLLLVIRSRAEKVTTSYSDTLGGGHNPSSRSDIYDKLVDAEQEQLKNIQHWCQAIKEVQIIISWLEDYDDRAVLEHRYINCENWLDISFSLNFSVQHLYYIHGRALYRLAMLLKDNKRK